MPEWAYLLIYVAGFLVACRLLAHYTVRYFDQPLLLAGFLALMWPIWLTAAVAVAPFAGLVWLATWGVKPRAE